jgi:hypothetical protein
MNAPINIQILKDAKGKPAFAVIPYAEYLSLSTPRAQTIPNAVVSKVNNKDMTPIRAWREHLGLPKRKSHAASASRKAPMPSKKQRSPSENPHAKKSPRHWG